MFDKATFATASGVIFAASLSATSAFAQESDTNKWRYEANVYVWGADIGGRTQTGEDLTISFSDLVDNLEFAAMGGFRASHGKFGLYVDAIYLDVENTEKSSIDLPRQSVDLRAKIDMETFITTLGGTYELYNAGGTVIYGFGGMRYLNIDLDLDFEFSRFNPSFDDSYDALDAVIGFQGKTDLSEKWYLSYTADIGTGDSDKTWQAAAAVNYRFDNFDLVAGYRYLEWDLNNFGPIDELDVSGAFIGARFHF